MNDVEIKIFGTVANPEAIWELADSAAAEGKIGWMTDFRSADFPAMLQQAAGEQRALTLTRRNTTDLFEEVRSSCQAAGLSYVLKSGPTGAEGFTEGVAWNPSLKDESEFLLSGKQLLFKGADVLKAASLGADAVKALVENVMDRTRVGQIEIQSGFLEAYQAFINDDEEPAGPSL